MRQRHGGPAETRSSVLWGRRSGQKANALWGRSRNVVAMALALLSLSFVMAGSAAGTSYTAFMTTTLTNSTRTNPNVLYKVIMKGTRGQSASAVSSAASSAIQRNPSGSVTAQYALINGVAATMSGAAIQALSHNTAISAIVQDSRVGNTVLSNYQLWPDVSQVSSFYSSPPAAPTIAVVDSGVDATRAADFGARVIAQPNFVNGNARNTRPGDGFGHGTFVAGIAAGQATGYAGAAPGANIVSLDVLDDTGAGAESDLISALNWVYNNQSRYNIRVVNLSVLAGTNASFMYDPLDQAVEKLWLSGVVVVTAAGNFAMDGAPSGEPYSPADDPFAITVGAADINGTVATTDDFNAPWSAYGYTLDGFAKPELGAPGRYMNGAVPTTAAMYTQHSERVVAPGYMWMSGTSFSAPVVSGLAADLLALHPAWTPDDVKGALMLTAAQPGPGTGTYALGVGEVQASAAAAVTAPPNPNAGLDAYVVSDPNGGRTFDAASWSSAARANASWNSASWNSASWNSASWNSASWSSASWSSASWNSASWSSGSTRDGTLPDASWASMLWGL